MSRDRRNRVFVGRLPPRIEERDLEKVFRGFGKILDINLKSGFAFVVSWRVEQTTNLKFLTSFN